MASAFDFSDDYGSDPIMRRYRRVGSSDVRTADAGLREAAAERQFAEAQAAKVQAELDAKLLPMKTAVDTMTNISNGVKAQNALREEASVRRGATAITEGLGAVKDLSEWVNLVKGNQSGLKDSEVGVNAIGAGLNFFKSATDSATTTYDVDRIYSSVPTSIAVLPEFEAAYNNARKGAERRENVIKNTATLGLGPVPTTPQGGIDVPQAEINLATEAGRKNTRAQAVENIKLLQDQISVINKQVDLGGGEPDDVQKLRLEALQNSINENLKVIDFGAPTLTPNPTPAAATGTAVEQPIINQNDAIGALLPTQSVESAVETVTDAQANTAAAQPPTQLTREQIEEGARALGLAVVKPARAGTKQNRGSRKKSVVDKTFKPDTSGNVNIEDEIQRAIESLYEDKTVLGLRFSKRDPSNMSGGVDRVNDVGAAKFLSQQDPEMVASIYEKLNRLQGSEDRAYKTSDGGWSPRVDSPEQLLNRIQQLSKNSK